MGASRPREALCLADVPGDSLHACSLSWVRHAAWMSCLVLLVFASSALAAAPRPPAPRVRTLDATRSASLVSYCWSQALPDGTGSGVCADGVLGRPAHSLRWRQRAAIYLDLRLPAHAVQVDAVRLGRPGTGPRHAVRVRPRRLGASRQHWVLIVPRRAARSNALLISARFAAGDLYAVVGLHPPPRPDE